MSENEYMWVRVCISDIIGMCASAYVPASASKSEWMCDKTHHNNMKNIHTDENVASKFR